MKSFIFATLCILLAACSPEKQDNVLLVATSADNPPFEFVRGGEVVGFDIDLINEIASRLGKTAKIKNISFQGLIPIMGSGEVDLVIAGLGETQKRKESMDFSIPYVKSSMSILTRADLVINSMEDLQGKTIGAQLGSLWHQKLLQEQKKLPTIKIATLSNNLLLMNELVGGKIEALIVESCQVDKYKEENKNLNSFEIADTTGFLSIAFSKGSELKPEIDKIITTLKNSGYIAFLEKKWFN